MQNLCALYLRVSTDNQADHGVSLPAQQSRLISYITAQGWDLHKIYTDDGYSGKNLDRPAMKQLLKDAKRNKFNRIIVIKLDRLSRSQKDALHLIEDVFDKNGITFTSVSESFDTSTPFGKASLGMLSVFAQLEREMIVDRILTAKKECAKQGRYLGGFVPYGYAYDDKLKKYVINPITASTIRLLFDSYQTGQFSFRGLADLLEAKKIPTHKDGKYWDKTTVRNMLTNPVYAGKATHKGQIYEGRHEPIISQEQFDTVRLMIEKQYVKPPTKEDDNLLVGFIRCGECGERMRYKNQNWNNEKKVYNQQYYICNNQYGYKGTTIHGRCTCGFKKVEAVNQAVIEYLLALSKNPSDIDDKIKEIITVDIPTANDKEQFVAELAKIEKKISRWFDAYEEEEITAKQLAERTKTLRKQEADLEMRIAEMEESKNILEEKMISAEATKEQLHKLPVLWDEFTPVEKRAVLARTIDRVTVFKDNTIDVTLNI